MRTKSIQFALMHMKKIKQKLLNVKIRDENDKSVELLILSNIYMSILLSILRFL